MAALVVIVDAAVVVATVVVIAIFVVVIVVLLFLAALSPSVKFLCFLLIPSILLIYLSDIISCTSLILIEEPAMQKFF